MVLVGTMCCVTYMSCVFLHGFYQEQVLCNLCVLHVVVWFLSRTCAMSLLCPACFSMVPVRNVCYVTDVSGVFFHGSCWEHVLSHLCLLRVQVTLNSIPVPRFLKVKEFWPRSCLYQFSQIELVVNCTPLGQLQEGRLRVTGLGHIKCSQLLLS